MRDNSFVFLAQTFILWTKSNFQTFKGLGENSPNSLSYLKLQVSISLTLHHSSVSWEITLLYFFSWNCTWFEQKEPIKVQNFRLSTAHIKFHQIYTLIGSFCWKNIKFQPKKYRGVISHDPEEWRKIWRKTDLLFQKRQEFDEFWPKHSKVSQICTSTGSYCAKYLMFDLKKYRGVIFHGNEGWSKIGRKTDFLFQKWQEFGEFWLKHSKVSQIYIFIGSYCAKYLMFDLKKYRGVIFHGNEEWCKIRRKTVLRFGKWHEQFGKFSPEYWRVSKLELSWDPFVQNRKCMSLKFIEEFVSWQWRMIQKFKRNWLVILKLT